MSLASETRDKVVENVQNDYEVGKEEINEIIDRIMYSRSDLEEIRQKEYLCVCCGACCRAEGCSFLSKANYCSIHNNAPDICKNYPVADVDGKLYLLLNSECLLCVKSLTLQVEKHIKEKWS